jgi:hypothetical protein
VQNQLVRYKSLRSAWLLLVLLLPACSKDGPEPEEDFSVPPQPPALPPETQFIELKQPFLGQIGCDAVDAYSLLSFDVDIPLNPVFCDEEFDVEEETTEPNPVRIATSENQISIDLYTAQAERCPSDSLVSDSDFCPDSRPDFTVVEDNGIIRLIDYQTNVVKAFVLPTQAPICELIPAEKVNIRDKDPAVNDKILEVLHEEFIYVVTALDGSSNACANALAIRQFTKLPFNFQFDALNVDVCATEEFGTSQALDCKTRLAPVVDESEARAQLVFGWVDDDETADEPSDVKLTYGYLGYSSVEQVLRFWNADREVQWQQDRFLERYTSDNVGQYNEQPRYIFELRELSDHQYVLQAGRDVFVFDSSTELFSRTAGGAGDVFSDRILKLAERLDSNGNSVVESADMVFNATDLIVVDQYKTFRFNYKDSFSLPFTTRDFIVSRIPLAQSSPELQGLFPFSQFDLQDCSFNADPAGCNAAHDFESPSWTLITDCTPSVDCSIETDTTDYCVLPSEETASTLAEERCTASRFEDLNELDDLTNNAEFTGFIQYGPRYFRNAEYQMYADSLLVTARMLERDILVRYFYDQALSAPKDAREAILIGQRLQHGGIEALIDEDDLYLNSLTVRSTIANRCSVGYAEVPCELSNLLTNGSGTCTGKDVAEGICKSSYNDYESHALFCSTAEVTGGLCNDNSIIPTNNLQVGAGNFDEKWIAVSDASNYILADDASLTKYYYLLRARSVDETQTTVSEPSYVKDEGILGNAEIVSVLNARDNLLGTQVGRMEGDVESLYPLQIDGTKSARIDANVNELFSASSASATSKAATYFFNVPEAFPSQVYKAGTLVYPRPETR